MYIYHGVNRYAKLVNPDGYGVEAMGWTAAVHGKGNMGVYGRSAWGVGENYDDAVGVRGTGSRWCVVGKGEGRVSGKVGAGILGLDSTNTYAGWFKGDAYVEGRTGNGNLIVKDGKADIGTTAPQAPLHVATNACVNAYCAKLRRSESPLILPDISDAAGHGVVIGGSGEDNSQLVVKSGGNVGIGTSDPGARLHIGGTPGVDGIMFPDGTLQTSAGGGLPSGSSGQTLRHDGMTWVTSSVLHNDGTNVGIGIPAPAEKLDIDGAIKLGMTDNANAGALIWSGTNFEGYDGSSWRQLDVEAPSGGGWTDDGTVVRLTTVTDNVGIGTDQPLSELTIHGGESVDDVALTLDVDGTDWHLGIDDSHGDRLKIGTGSSVGSNTKVTIQTDGNVGIGTETPTDARLEVVSSGNAISADGATGGVSASTSNYNGNAVFGHVGDT